MQFAVLVPVPLCNMTGSETLKTDDHFVITCHVQYVGNESAPIISWNGSACKMGADGIVALETIRSNVTIFLRAFFGCFVRLEHRPDDNDNVVSMCNCKSAALNISCSHSIAIQWHCKGTGTYS